MLYEVNQKEIMGHQMELTLPLSILSITTSALIEYLLLLRWNMPFSELEYFLTPKFEFAIHISQIKNNKC